MTKRIVIVGGVAAGASCAARARRMSEDAEIVILERGEHVSFANCGLPYYVGGEIAERSKLFVQTPESLRARFNLDVRTRNEATSINVATKTVTVLDLEKGQPYELPFDDLVLAPGAAPLRPPIPGIERPGHFTLRDIRDVDAIMNWIGSGETKRAVVVGGGYIGLELLEQLHRRGIAITLVEALDQVMGPLDVEMAEILHGEIRNHGVELLLRDGVESFEPGDCRASVVRTRSGKTLPADIVVLGLGVRPEVALAKTAGVELGERGGIKVNAKMQTSVPGIWAAGDCVEVIDGVTQAPSIIPLAGPANRQGRIVADNIFGGSSEYHGTLGTAVLRLFELAAACTGANEKTLRKLGRPHKVVHLHPNSHAGYYPGAETVSLKIIFDPSDGKLLGAQAVGKDGIDKRIDVLATALKGGMTVDDLAELELAYAPPFGSAKDPVNLAGMAAQNIRRGLVESITAEELGALTSPHAVLDVRDLKERERGAIPGSLHIPINELRRRLNELPTDRELIVSCQSGQRSYYACRILMQRGFRCRNLSGAFRTWGLTQRA